MLLKPLRSRGFLLPANVLVKNLVNVAAPLARAARSFTNKMKKRCRGRVNVQRGYRELARLKYQCHAHVENDLEVADGRLNQSL
jgi:hypothetical protein